MDIKALTLLNDRRTSLEEIIKLANQDVIDDTRRAESISEDTIKSVTKVNEYAVDIRKAIEDLRGKVNEFNMKIGDIMVQLSKGEFTYLSTSGGVNKKFLHERMKQQQEMQRIAKQQNELLELMNETNKVLTSIEEDGEISIATLENLQKNIDRYRRTIETKDRKTDEQEKEEQTEKLRQEEERKRKEDEQRREERKRQEEEKRKREEERVKEEKRREEQRKRDEDQRRMEEEKKKMDEQKRCDPDNWPTHRYFRKDASTDSFHRNINCLAWAIGGPNGFSKNDVSCTETNPTGCLQRGDVLQSDMIRMSCNEKKRIILELPMRVYVPYKPTDSSREVTMKARINDEKWKQADVIKKVPKDAEKDIYWIGTEVNNFRSLDLVVVSRLKSQRIPITPGGGTFPVGADTKIVLTEPGSIQWPLEMHHKVENVGKKMENRRDIDNVSVVSATHEFSFESKLQKDVTLQMTMESSSTIRMLSHMKAIQRCRDKLIKEMSLDSVLDYMQQGQFISSSFCTEIKHGKGDSKTNARKLLDHFGTCSTKEYVGFVDALRHTNQTFLAQLLEKETSGSDEDILDSDFEGDLKIVVKTSEESETTILSTKDLKNEDNSLHINLSKGSNLYSVVGMVVPKTMLDEGIRATADKVQDLFIQMSAALVIRQNENDPSEVRIACALTDEMPRCIKDLEYRGFVHGPKDLIKIGIAEGDCLRVTTVGNIQVASKDQENLSQQFFSIKCPVNISFAIKERDKKGKVSQGYYVGRIQFFVEGKGKTLMTDSFIVYLPVGDDFKRYAPVILDAEVSVTAKYVAVMLGKKTQSVEMFFQDLAGQNQYRQLVNRSKRESKTGDDQEKWELFMINWAAQRPRSENKVKEILDLLSKYYPELVEKTMAFVDLYRGDKDGILSTKGLEKIAERMEGKWKDVAKVLKIDKNEIAEIEETFPDDQRCAQRMLDQWRFSSDAVQKGMDVIEHFMSALRSANCSRQTIQVVDEMKTKCK